MARLTLEIATELRDAGFKDAADRLENLNSQIAKTKEGGGAAQQAFADLKGELLGFASVVGVLEFFKGMVDAAAADQEAMELLGSKVESAGRDFNLVRPQVEEFTKALSEQTRFGKTEYLTAIGNMIDRVHDLGTAEQLVTTAAGLAVARHMDLASASDLVAALHEKQARATLNVARTLGLSTKEAKDSELVLKTLQDRYANLAQQESSYQAQTKELGNQFTNMKAVLGDTFLPLVILTEKVLMSLFVVIVGLGRQVVDLATGPVRIAIAAFDTWINILKHPLSIRENWHKAFAEFSAIGKEFTEDAKKSAGEFARIWGAKGPVPEALAKLPEAARASLDETDLLIAQFNAKGQLTQEQAFKARLKLLQEQHIVERQMLIEHLNQLHETKANIDRAVAASDRAYDREVLAEKRKMNETVEKLLKDSLKTGSQAIGKALFGDKAAFKDAAKSIIDSVANEAEAYVIAKSMEAALNDAAKVGLIAGLPIIAQGAAVGVAEAGLIATAAEGAKAALGAGGSSGGGSSTSASASMPAAVAPSASASSAAPATAAGPGQLVVNVHGDFLGDPQVVEMFAKRLSSAVEDRGVRLVSSKTA